MTEITAAAHSRAGTLLASLDDSHGRQWQDTLNDTGSGALTLQNDDVDLALIPYGSVIRFAIDGTTRFSALVEQKTRVSISQDEEVAEVTILAGRGTAAVMEEGVVSQATGQDGVLAAFSDSRVFNFASLDLASPGWTAAIPTGLGGSPEGWCDPTAVWIWDADLTAVNAPGGDVYFRRLFTVAARTSVEVWAAADDAYDLWLDGVPLLQGGPVYLGQAGKAGPLTLEVGTHLLAVKATNANALKAGLRVAVMELNGTGGQVGVLVDSVTASTVNTSNGWTILAYPAVAPGFTPGRILEIVVAEAQTRGALTGLTLGFTAAADSASVAWPVTSDVSLALGVDLLSVLRQLTEGYLDFRMSATGLTLNAYVSVGSASAAVLARAVNLTELTHVGKA